MHILLQLRLPSPAGARCGDPVSSPPLNSGEGDREAVVGFSDKQQTPKEPLSLATLDSSPFRGAKDGDDTPLPSPSGKVARQSRDG